MQQLLFGLGDNGGSGGGGDLFDFTSFTFQTANLTGRTGPTKTQLLSHYNTSSFAWLNNSSYFDVDSNAQGVQMFTVPSDGNYRIICAGASGGYSYDASRTNRVGRGAEVYGEFSLTQGTILRIVVGQKGRPVSTSNPDGPLTGQAYNSGGGGGSFVFYTLSDTEPLVAAGGGGGGAYSGQSGYRPDAATDLTGNPGTGVNNEGNNTFSGLLSGQNLGYGGINIVSGLNHRGGGGAGWKGNGSGGHSLCSVQSPYHVQGGWSKSKSLDTSSSTSNGGPFMGGWGGNNQAGNGSQQGGFGGGGGGTGRCGSCQAGGGGGYTGGGINTSTDNSPTKEALAGGGNYVISSASNRTYSGLRNAGESGFVTITKL